MQSSKINFIYNIKIVFFVFFFTKETAFYVAEKDKIKAENKKQGLSEIQIMERNVAYTVA